MKNLGEEIKEATLLEKILRSLSSKFESIISSIEEKKDLQSITIVQLHGILAVFEIRKGGQSNIREDSFKASRKGKEKEDIKESGYISKEDEINFVKKLQWGSRRFRGKIPFNFFSCAKVGHYATKCPHKGNHDKGKDSTKGNRKKFVNKRIYYTHEDSDTLSKALYERSLSLSLVLCLENPLSVYQRFYHPSANRVMPHLLDWNSFLFHTLEFDDVCSF